MSTSGDVSDKELDLLFKVLVIGEPSVGKTSIIKRYTEGFFSGTYRHTIGVDFALKQIDWDTNTSVRLQLWDIAGQERFGAMTHIYYKEASAAICVFSLTHRHSFEAIARWKHDLDAKVKLPSGTPIPAFLVGNKNDLLASAKKEDQIGDVEIEAFSKEMSFAGWFKTSAKENENIESLMQFVISTIINNDESFSSGRHQRGTILLNPNTHPSTQHASLKYSTDTAKPKSTGCCS